MSTSTLNEIKQNEDQSTNTMDNNYIKTSIEYLQIIALTQQQNMTNVQQNLSSLQAQLEQQTSQMQLLQSKLNFLMELYTNRS